jgi:hypothetical protein
MIWFLIGTATLALLYLLLGAFARASITQVKTLFAWLAAIGGVLAALMLILTGRGGLASLGFFLLGPLIWERWLGPLLGRRAGTAGPGGQGQGQRQHRPRRSPGGMSREEAYQVLGLKPGASKAEIRAAHRRLMATAHPDKGGSDWIAARLNQARDTLLG